MNKLSNANKVPEVILLFWIIKMMSTTVGETAADFFSFDLHLGIIFTTFVTGILLIISLIFQFKSKHYSPPIYWTVVVLISVFGTLITDNLTDKLHVPLAFSTAVFSALLIMIFKAWHSSEKTLAITSINSPKRERFYWLSILITFALGTAAGDWISEGMDVGYLHSIYLFGGLIVAIAFLTFITDKNKTLYFWLAYILTRPLGASIGDYLSQPTSDGGLGIGATLINSVFLSAIIISVAYLTVDNKKSDN